MEYNKEFLGLLNNKTIYWVDSNGDFIGINSFDINIYKRLGNAILFNNLYSNRYQKGFFSIVHSVMVHSVMAKKEFGKSDNWYCFYRDYSAFSHNKFLVKVNNEFCFMHSSDIGKLIKTGRQCFFSLWEIIEHLDIDIEKSYKHGTDY